ncbi:MAG: hypothetical protein ABI430_04475 [Candidatus Taylorbacteria bacterium]
MQNMNSSQRFSKKRFLVEVSRTLNISVNPENLFNLRTMILSKEPRPTEIIADTLTCFVREILKHFKPVLIRNSKKISSWHLSSDVVPSIVADENCFLPLGEEKNSKGDVILETEDDLVPSVAAISVVFALIKSLPQGTYEDFLRRN